MSSMNCYITTATATPSPIPHDSAKFLSPPNNAKPSLLTKRQSKWAAAAAPLDPDIPLETSKLRKYWGGEEEDPLTSDDYIWNKDFVDRFKKMIREPDNEASEASPVKEESSGFLSLNRVMSLNSVEIDLSKELTAPPKSVFEEIAEPPTRRQDSRKNVPKWRLAPTRREQDKWDRASKATTGGTDVMLREVRRPRGDPAVLAAKSREQYFELKNKMQNLTLGIGGVGLVSAYLSYTPEIAFSYGVGLLGSLMYIRMLGSSIDSMADAARGLSKGSMGQPRLLVPVALVMIFNRWNEILVPQYGCFELQLIPMLVGLFTYKIATFYQAIEESLTVDTKKPQV